MSGIVVTKSSPVLVVPSSDSSSSPPASGDTDTVTLSSFDKCIGPVPVTALLVYDVPIHKPAETVKKALAMALAHYRPLAGRLVTGADGESFLSCTGEGVTFVAASANSDAKLEAVATSPALLKDLAVFYPGDHLCRDADPLLLVQVTEFSCGGFVVGVTWNHIVTDAVGMAQFLQAVGELARGVSPAPSVVPVRRWDDSLPSLPASMVSSAQTSTTTDHATQDDLVHIELTIPASLVRRIKAETGATVYEAVTAVLWRCRTRAAMALSCQRDSEPESPAPLMFLCNMRTHAGAMDGYYGNCVAVQMVPATKGAVAASSIGDLVRLIRHAKEKAPNVLSGGGSSSGNVDGDHAAVTGGEPPQPQIGWYDTLAVSSWRNLGLDKVDLGGGGGGGGGGPARVMWYAERNSVPGCEVCPPCTLGEKKEDGGVSVSSACVKMEHVEAFLGELTRLATSTLVA